ncbi:MAG TPA: PP2C family protein-serine/threonine phosphatase [Terracidiphilus sp.]|nr:PP2C family protein-serine/threonine phosphatase [Terracidiphilus sp.]
MLLAAAVAARGQQTDLLRLPLEQWQLHVGDDPRCATVDGAGCTLEKFAQDVSRYGIEWRRIEVTLPPNLLHSQQPLGLIVQGEDPVCQVFVNGQLIGGTGSFGNYKGPQDSRVVLKLPGELPADGRLVIAIRLLQVHSYLPVYDLNPTIAPLNQTQQILDEDTLDHLRANWQHYVCFGLMGCIGLVFFLLFSVNTSLREYFWLGAMLTLLFAFRVGEFAAVVNIGMPSWVGIINYYVGNGIQTAIIIEFVFSFLGRPVPKIFRLLEIVGGLSFLNLFLLAPPIYRGSSPLVTVIGPFLLHAYGISIILATLTQLLLVPMCFRSKLAEMRWIGGTVLFLTIMEGTWQAGWTFSNHVIQTIHWGALEFDLRPLAWLLFAVVMLIAMTFRLRRIQDRNRHVEQELAAARSVQQILIPDELPSIPGLRIDSAYLPAQEVGGDFFQILPIPNTADPEKPSAFIVLGDVSGKGLKAAMTVSLIVGTLRTYAEFCSSPSVLLAGLNRRLCGRGDGFATCLVLLTNPTGKIIVANAGHPNPYIAGVELQTEANLPLGIDAGVTYSEIAFELHPDQVCTLVTDGVIEATSAGGELYGFERTQAISNRSADTIAQTAREFGQQDDITVLTLSHAIVSV